MDSLIGQVLEQKYEILERIGEGGMAVVYRGRHLTLDREVAIKVLHPHLSGSARNRERFSREARAIESLQHERILRIYDYSGPESDRCFIVTEFVHGRTLGRALEDLGPLPGEVAALMVRDLAGALSLAHGRGIVHRDIKPENVMIDATGHVKLMDFGIARFIDEARVTVTGGLVGSPAYMSPEQVREAEVDGRTDIYSLGTLMYQMVTGEMPYSGSTTAAVLHAILKGEHPPPQDLAPDLDPGLARVIEGCMRTSREDRYPDVAALIEAIDACLRPLGIGPEGGGGRFSPAAFFADPGAYRERLRQHLVPLLVRTGRELLARRRTAEAMATLNRVLVIDEDNREVPEIVARLGRSRRPAWAGPAATAVGLTSLAAAAVALAWIVGLGTSGAGGATASGEAARVAAAGGAGADAGGAGTPPPPERREPAPLREDPRESPPTPSPEAEAGRTAASPPPEAGPRGARTASLSPRLEQGATLRSYRPSVPRPADPAGEGAGPGERHADADAGGSGPRIAALESAPPQEQEPEPIPDGWGTLQVLTPGNDNWTAYVDGREVGKSTDMRQRQRWRSGRYVLEIRGAYIQDWRKEVVVLPGQAATVRPTLDLIPARLAFEVGEGVEVRIDGERVGIGPGEISGRQFPVEPGRAHRVECIAPGGRSILNVTLDRYDPGPGEEKTLSCRGS
ncbi:protein kinase [Myxococcota bacterium]|nr:protein kinase [Myxococcota bacterium]